MNDTVSNASGIFLTAEWRKLAIANYIIEPSILQSFLPAFTELDLWNGRCYVSLVAFLFQNTRVKRCKFPFHTNFEEVNLRFYVRYRAGNEWRRGVVFIREFVPLPAVTIVANNLYQERYRTVPMRHQWVITPQTIRVNYSWKRGQQHSFAVNATNTPLAMLQGSEEEFITQHFWGYSQKRAYTSEYHVDHEPWMVYPVDNYNISVDFEACYGSKFSFIDKLSPQSVFLAEGSPIVVYKDKRLYA